jgi:hypothetical protein
LQLIGLVPQGTELLEQKHIMTAIANQSAPAEPVKELESSTPKKKIKRAK